MQNRFFVPSLPIGLEQWNKFSYTYDSIQKPILSNFFSVKLGHLTVHALLPIFNKHTSLIAKVSKQRVQFLFKNAKKIIFVLYCNIIYSWCLTVKLLQILRDTLLPSNFLNSVQTNLGWKGTEKWIESSPSSSTQPNLKYKHKDLDEHFT